MSETCPAGHEWNEANTYFKPSPSKNGTRKCRACSREKQGAARELKNRAAGKEIVHRSNYGKPRQRG